MCQEKGYMRLPCLYGKWKTGVREKAFMFQVQFCLT